jgi:hypothetical protein
MCRGTTFGETDEISEGSVTSLSDILLRLPSQFFAPQRLHTAERIKTPTLFMAATRTST